ncbi:MAG: nuclear transport factor 2 family protein [Planctomycetaceae bacterium]|nr:nuclear transport factor 2 family protein [Planctomycetaceae bacterium]
MQHNSRYVAVNGRELRAQRLSRGLTQDRLGKLAGYTDRLVRKAEKGGTLDIATVQDLAEALSMTGEPVSCRDLTLDILSIARLWMECFEELQEKMLPKVESFYAPEFELICPGDPGSTPFVGTWRGLEGMQQWLDLFFGFFVREKAEHVEYFVGENSVVARWMERCSLQGVPCDPVRINLYFEFRDGRIVRMCDDYDTHSGATAIEKAQSNLKDNGQAD